MYFDFLNISMNKLQNIYISKTKIELGPSTFTVESKYSGQDFYYFCYIQIQNVINFIMWA